MAVAHSASYYERFGRDAIRYVKGKLTLGSSNNPSDILRHPITGIPRYFMSAWEQSKGAPRIVESLRAQQLSRSDPRFGLTLVETWAREAERMKAGNCALQAAVAFCWLRDHGVFPIDFMKFGGNADHGFVIMGREGGSDLAKFAEWTGGATMVCDPWRAEVGAAGMLAVWYKKTNVELVARLDEPA